MELKKYKSVSEIPDRELLEAIYAAQLVIYRELALMQKKKDGEGLVHPSATTRELVDKTNVWHQRINNYLRDSNSDENNDNASEEED